MNDTTQTHEEWLEAEIALDDELLALYEGQDSADALGQAQVDQIRRDREEKLIELQRLRSGSRLRVRLSGGAIEGTLAPSGVVQTWVRGFEEIADEYSADVLVAPAGEGSHVIEFVSPSQLSAVEGGPGDSFLDAAAVLVDLAPDTYPEGSEPGEVIKERASALSDESLRAVKSIIKELHRNRINASIGLSSSSRSVMVRFDEAFSAYLDVQLGQLDRTSERQTIRGWLRGFTQGSGRFEIEPFDGDLIAGRVPKAARSMATGISIDSEVVAIVEQITTTLPSGGTRRHYRLAMIDRLQADSD